MLYCRYLLHYHFTETQNQYTNQLHFVGERSTIDFSFFRLANENNKLVDHIKFISSFAKGN